jgi:hypothetical protein
VRIWHSLIIAAALAGGASTTAAQFTGVVAPPKAKPSAEAVAAAAGDSARRDTSVSVRLTEMKAWVDSAAVAVAVAPAADTAVRMDTVRTDTTAERGGQRVRTETSTGDVMTYRSGAPAPDTATPLPFILLVGAGALLTGAWLRRR